MTANELAKLLEVDSWRQQAEQIENLKQWERRHLDVIEKQQEQIKDLKQQVAFLEDWRDTWSPTIKQLMNINVKVNDEWLYT